MCLSEICACIIIKIDMFKLMTVRGNNYKKKKTNTVTVILAPDIPTYPVLQSFQILLKISRSVELTERTRMCHWTDRP